MKKTMKLSAVLVFALSMALVATQAMAQVGPLWPGGTPGGPSKGPTPTGTLQPGQGYGPPSNVQPPNIEPMGTPGGPATNSLKGKPTIYRGTISAVDASSITIIQADGSPVSAAITPETRIKVPGPQARGDTLIKGMQVVLQAVADADGNLAARMILAIPGTPALTHRVGTVTAYTAGATITIQATDGNPYTFILTTDTKILPPGLAETLAVGSLVTIIAPRDPAALGWTAAGIVVHPAQPG